MKAAYLSVFSLLGVHGYRYAEGEAIEPVRKQVMKPEDEVIRNFAVNAPAAWRERDGIAMNRKRRPCWAVKVGDCIVLLPRSWDQSYYEWTSSMSPPNEKITIGGGPRWNPAKFGSRRVASISFQEGHNPIKILGDGMFGIWGRVTQGDRVTPFVFADSSGQEVTVMLTDGLEKS